LEKLRAALATIENKSILLHGHCYQKAQPPADDGIASGAQATAALLSALGFQVEVVNSGCCGMAGSFGYEAEHYDLSMQIGEMVLFPAVRAAASQQVVAAGVSCRAQIASGTGREALHPVSLIAAQLAY
jgi:Fe-S oxidoreductase